jgi:uncharacterized repeat protein (TIGR01451 family)
MSRLFKPPSSPKHRVRGIVTSNNRHGHLLASMALALCVLGVWVQPVHAEGSRTMYPSGATGNRANLDQRSTSTLAAGKLRARTIFKVYANAGEYITLASSAVGLGSGDIYVYNPGLVTGTVGQETLPATPSFRCSTQRTSTGNNNLGRITSRTQELAGPDTITNAATGARGNAVPTGFVPCYYQAPQTGIYDVYFVPPTPSDNTSSNTTGDIALTSANNFSTSQDNNVAAWDITVRSSLTSTSDINGRLFAYYAFLRHGANSRYAYFSLYPVTLDGFRYQVNLNGLDPNSFTVYGNRSGFLDSDGVTPLYHDVLGSDDLLTSITGNAVAQIPQFPTFWNPPDVTVIATLGIPLAPTAPVVSNFSFAGSINNNNSLIGAGGTFTFTANVSHTYEIVVSRDGVNFDPTNSSNRVLRGIRSAGTHNISWDGKDNSGANFPVGTNYAAKIVIVNGEYHFPILDAENSLGGPRLTMLNPPGGCNNGNCNTAFYDDRGYKLSNGTTIGTVGSVLPGTSPPATAFSGISGFDSSTNQRAFGNGSTTGWGDRKGLDIWTYYPSSAVNTSINILPVAPDLTITKTHTGNFTQGQTGATYAMTVTNSGTSLTSGTVTLTDTLPTGLTATSAAGTGWTCSISGQTVTCTRNDALAASSSYPAITLTVNVATNAASSLTNTASVSGGGETNTSNNTASDATTINGVPDLTITKTHTGNFTQGSTGSYTITATNSGAATTTGLVTVTDTLPTGLTPTSASGTGWNCSVSGQTVTCTRSDTLATGASYPAITLNVTVASNAASNITNTASISGGGEVVTNNNSASDPTNINSAVTTISGTLYQDSDGGDDFDSGEPTLPANITVRLLDSTGATTIATTTTNASGQYTFSGVVNGTYRIQVDTTDTDIPAGFTLGTPNNLSVTVSGSAITGRDFGFDAPVTNSCSIGGGTPDGSIAPYISAEVRSDTITSRNVVDTLDDNWRTAANAPSIGTIQPWFGTNTANGTLTSFTYRDPSTAANINTTVELVDVAISSADTCAGQNSTSAAQLDNNNTLQDTAPRPASLYNTANQPLFWNQTGAGANGKRAAVRFTFAQPVKSFGAWFGDLETRTVGATPAILRLLDASGNRIGSDIVIQPTDVYENSTTATAVDQSLCGSISPGIDKGCGNKATRWIGFVDSSVTARVKQVLVIVGDDDQGDDGDTERISFIGANVVPGSPNVLLVKRITAVNGSTTTNGGDNLANYINEAANPYDDNTIEPGLAPNPPAYPTPDTDKWLTPSTFLVGGINGGAVQPNDILEYTIYFLSTGSQPAKNVRFCDRVPGNTTFVATAFGSSPDRGIALRQGGTISNLTNVPDSDAAQYFPPGVDPATIYPGINCGGANTNGAVVVELGDLPNATIQGSPSGSYGFVRFWGKVK